MAPLLCGHCLQINIEFQSPVIFVDEVTALAEIVVKIDDLVSGHGVGDTLYIDVAALLTADLVLDVGNLQMAGRVLDNQGNPIAAATIALTWELLDNGLVHRSLRRTTSSADGSFLFTQLGGVARELSVTASGFQTALMEGVRGGGLADLEIQLERPPE